MRNIFTRPRQAGIHPIRLFAVESAIRSEAPHLSGRTAKTLRGSILDSLGYYRRLAFAVKKSTRYGVWGGNGSTITSDGGKFHCLSSCRRLSHCSVRRRWSRNRARPSCCSARHHPSRRCSACRRPSQCRVPKSPPRTTACPRQRPAPGPMLARRITLEQFPVTSPRVAVAHSVVERRLARTPPCLAWTRPCAPPRLGLVAPPRSTPRRLARPHRSLDSKENKRETLVIWITNERKRK
jgi:hypothetical protein